MDDDKAIATRKGIGSLELGLEVLELISEHSGPISLTKLSELAKMSPSRLHKYLVSLTKLGYDVFIVTDKFSSDVFYGMYDFNLF